MCLFLQILNYRGNEKYVLVLVQVHDGMITSSVNLFLRLTLVFDTCKTKQIDLVRDHCIMTLDTNQNLILLDRSCFLRSWLASWRRHAGRGFLIHLDLTVMRQSMFLTILACFLEASRRPGIFNSFRSYSYETEHVSYDLGLLLGGVVQAWDF